MGWGRASIEALRGLLRNPLRACLVLLTLALGYASVLVTVAAVEGGRRALRHDLESLATDVIACLSPGRLGPLSIGGAERGPAKAGKRARLRGQGESFAYRKETSFS